MNNSEEKEIVWLPKKLADKVKALENSDNFVDDYIEQSRTEIRANLDTFDSEIIEYRANMIKARKAFEIAKDEMIKASYEIWDKFQDDKKSLCSMATELTNGLLPLTNELKKINDMINGLDEYKIKGLVNLVKAFNNECYGENAKILKFLMDNYKKD
jgi:hypothetical protein